MKFYPIHSVVIAMYGATIGKVGLLDIETATNQACCIIVPSKRICPKYTFYSFIIAKEELLLSSFGGGQPNISQDIIRKIKKSPSSSVIRTSNPLPPTLMSRPRRLTR